MDLTRDKAEQENLKDTESKILKELKSQMVTWKTEVIGDLEIKKQLHQRRTVKNLDF